MSENISVVEYFKNDGEDRDGNRCGYCKGSNTGFSQGMWGHRVSCQDYQDLVDRGWRRSGQYLYKPTMNKTCCPLYSIKCAALEFQPSKSHKKVIKKVTKFLQNESIDKIKEQTAAKRETAAKRSEPTSCNHANDPEKEEPKKPLIVSTGPDPDKPLCRKAKLMRLERKHQKLAAKGIEMSDLAQENKIEAKSFEDLLSAHFPSEQSKHKLECKLLKCDTNLPAFQSSYQQSFELFCKYQKNVHKDKPAKLNEGRVKLVRVDMENEEFVDTLSQSHAVFANYQMNVHNDSPSECGLNQFKRFLVDSPLVFEKNASSPSTGWGSFHEQFYLDGKLIAVGVLDILPYCVSSVYFFYDTDYSHLSLGVYSALREIQFTRELNKTSSQLQYYYMGFYVHSCPKMRYKANYKPSYLVCPESYSWIAIEKCLPKLDMNKYSRLDDTDKEDPVVDIDTVLVLVPRRGLMVYRAYRSLRGAQDNDEVCEYAQLVGPNVAPRMALYRG